MPFWLASFPSWTVFTVLTYPLFFLEILRKIWRVLQQRKVVRKKFLFSFPVTVNILCVRQEQKIYRRDFNRFNIQKYSEICSST
jgi:hypothetical protein